MLGKGTGGESKGPGGNQRVEEKRKREEQKKCRVESADRDAGARGEVMERREEEKDVEEDFRKDVTRLFLNITVE